MNSALTLAFAGMCMLMLAYMALSLLGFFNNGRCLIGMGVIALALWAMRDRK